MLKLVLDSKFEKDLKRLKKKHYNITELKTVSNLLVNEQPLPGKYHDHALHGDMQGYKECHIADNWLLLYTKTATTITLISTGSHDELFK
jgi:mRNA interferase YafQ